MAHDRASPSGPSSNSTPRKAPNRGRSPIRKPHSAETEELRRQLDQLQQQVAALEVSKSLDRREYRDILDASPAVVYVKRVDGTYEFVNRRFAHLFGITCEEAVGKSDMEIFPGSPEVTTAFRENDELVARSGLPLTIEEIAPHADGPHTYLSVKFPLRDQTGHVRAVAGISTDITDAKRFEEVFCELHAAAELQRRFSPPLSVELPGFDIAADQVPSRDVCGDYFDFIPLETGELALVVGDASGHDLAAALFMMTARAYLRGLIAADASLSDVITRLDRLLTQDAGASKFMSLFLGKLNPHDRRFEYACAGHDCLWLGHNGDSTLLHSQGLVLGLDDAALDHHADGVFLNPGDLLLFATDGVFEALNVAGELFGRRRVIALLNEHRERPSAEIVQILLSNVQRFANAHTRKDDMTAIVVKVV